VKREDFSRSRCIHLSVDNLLQIKEPFTITTAFSVASWNIEHFGSDLAGDRDPETVLSLLAEQHPDVIGIYKVSSSRVLGPIMEAFPDHTFHITEGP